MKVFFENLVLSQPFSKRKVVESSLTVSCCVYCCSSVEPFDENRIGQGESHKSQRRDMNYFRIEMLNVTMSLCKETQSNNLVQLSSFGLKKLNPSLTVRYFQNIPYS